MKHMSDRDFERRSDEGGRGLERSRFRGLSRDPESRYAANPLSLMRRFSDDIDRMFSGAWGDREFAGRDGDSWNPAVEVRERDGQLIVHADLPGLNKEDVKVE